MRYNLHYETLIDRARNRTPKPDEYYETHHIIPRCVGGTDESNNLVQLTPEEHYTAHLLLIRIYPDSNGLVFAASMMTVDMNEKETINYTAGLDEKCKRLLSRE